ncbi:MAG: T9SS type A sorting domain-containing protein [Chitinophagaceae bacterium]|nr:T9SS type A sorting domain-containing protein [Chitinophagaceae bacterium]
MVWETVWNGQPFSGNPITNSVTVTASQPLFSNLGLTGTELKYQISKRVGHKATYLRARVKYDLVTAITGQVYGPWRYPEGFLRGRRDIGSVALPVKFISFNVVKKDKSALLKWITVVEERGVRFEIQHSINGINFTALTSFNGWNQTRKEYEWLHVNPAKGNNFYRIRAVENQKEVFTNTKILNFSDAAMVSIFPNPAVVNQALSVESVSIKLNQPLKISCTNSAGQLVWQKEITATTNGRLIFNFPAIPGGAYLLQVQAGQWTDSKKIIVADR